MKPIIYCLALLCVALLETSCNTHKLASTSNTNVDEPKIFPNSITIVRNKSVPADYMTAAIEAIKKLGKFEPGKLNGTPVKVTLTLPIIYPIPLDRIVTSE